MLTCHHFSLRLFAIAVAGLGLLSPALSAESELPTVAAGTASDFLPAISLAPFVVEGEDLSISIRKKQLSILKLLRDLNISLVFRV